MATVFGMSGLRSRLEDWRASWRNPQRKSIELPSAEQRTALFPVTTRRSSTTDEQRLSVLIENIVIPRLIADETASAAQPDTTVMAEATVPPFSDADVENFAQLSLTDDSAALLDFVHTYNGRGASVETIYVDLLAPAARRLGTYWEDDSRNFLDVTMGLWRIQEVLRHLAAQTPPPVRHDHGQRSALFCPIPGEQHSFGALMVAETFQRAGWDGDVLVEPEMADILKKVAVNRYHLIGLTVSCDCSTAALRSLVDAVRLASANPEIRILLGGHFINQHPLLVGECGADATADNARAAVALAEQLVPVEADFFAQFR